MSLPSTFLLVGNFLSSKNGSRSVGEELADRLQGKGFSVVSASRQRFRPLRFLDMLFTAWLHRKKYQVAYVEVYSGLAFIWAESVCWILNKIQKPYIVALHGGNLPVFACRWPKRVKRLLSSAPIAIAPSSYLIKEMFVYRRDIHLIPNPIEVRSYPFRLRSKPEPHLIWLRAFHNIYNPQMVPSIMAELRKVFPGIVVTMIGPDKGDGALYETQKRIEAFGLQQSIKIVKGIPKSHVPKMLELGDIFINTANIDNTPVSVIEAMASGLCVISTNVGGIPYLLEDQEDSLLVPADDVDAMVVAVKRILTEPDLAERLSGNARRKAEQFDWSVVLPQWEKLFSEVASLRTAN